MKLSVISSMAFIAMIGGVASFINRPASSSLSSSSGRGVVPATSTLSTFSLRSSSTSTTTVSTSNSTTTIKGMPPYSPATDLPNLIYNWRDYNIRYQVSGPNDANHVLLLVHGLFVNSDHWRKALTGLQQQQQQTGTPGADDTSGTTKQKTCRIYALDLLGSGWSSKPSRLDPQAMSVDGENGRFIDCDSICYRDNRQQASKGGGSSRRLQKKRSASTLQNVPLGTSAGGNRMASSLELRHPLRSPYNFYTWAEQLADFTRDVIHADILHNSDDCKKVTLISNSIGTMSSLQSIIDEPYLYNGIFIINPNFRELHMAEVPFSPITMPLVRTLQSTLRENGHGLFKTLATPSTVKTILKEPYSVVDAIDDELVSVLLQPLLTEGADDVVFDTLSYSAGPLPEQQLRSKNFPVSEVCPVWVAYGKDDPWTPAKRVEALGRMIVQRSRLDESGKVVDTDVDEMAVERVIGLVGAGHCPHDEVPEKVNELILEFLDRLEQ